LAYFHSDVILNEEKKKLFDPREETGVATDNKARLRKNESMKKLWKLKLTVNQIYGLFYFFFIKYELNLQNIKRCKTQVSEFLPNYAPCGDKQNCVHAHGTHT